MGASTTATCVAWASTILPSRCTALPGTFQTTGQTKNPAGQTLSPARHQNTQAHLRPWRWHQQQPSREAHVRMLIPMSLPSLSLS